MAIIFNKTENNFTQINNKIIKDKNLTFGARGLMCLMLSRPESWDFNMNELSSNTNESYSKVQSYIKELENHKYIFRIKRGVPKTKGKFEWLYFLNGEGFNEEDIKEIMLKLSKIENSNDDTILRQSLATTVVGNDNRKNGSYNNTELFSNTEYNINTKSKVNKKHFNLLEYISSLDISKELKDCLNKFISYMIEVHNKRYKTSRVVDSFIKKFNNGDYGNINNFDTCIEYSMQHEWQDIYIPTELKGIIEKEKKFEQPKTKENKTPASSLAKATGFLWED